MWAITRYHDTKSHRVLQKCFFLCDGCGKTCSDHALVLCGAAKRPESLFRLLMGSVRLGQWQSFTQWMT